MCYKVLFITVLTMLANLGHASESLLVGMWKCDFKSEIINTKQTIKIMENGDYEFITSVFASEMVDLGTWSLQKDTLTLNRHTHITRSKKETSNHTSTHKIKKLSTNTFIFVHGKGISECSR